MTTEPARPRGGATGAPAIPTVAKLARPKRCSVVEQTDPGHRRRCRLFSDTALDAQVLCPLHLREALWPGPRPVPSHAHDPATAAQVRPTAEQECQGDLLREVLAHLHLGIPDPGTDGQQLLVVVPTTLAERIADILARPEPGDARTER